MKHYFQLYYLSLRIKCHFKHNSSKSFSGLGLVTKRPVLRGSILLLFYQLKYERNIFSLRIGSSDVIYFKVDIIKIALIV